MWQTPYIWCRSGQDGLIKKHTRQWRGDCWTGTKSLGVQVFKNIKIRTNQLLLQSFQDNEVLLYIIYVSWPCILCEIIIDKRDNKSKIRSNTVPFLVHDLSPGFLHDWRHWWSRNCFPIRSIWINPGDLVRLVLHNFLFSE